MTVTFLQLDSERRQAGLSVKALCHAVGAPTGEYYRWRTGKRTPRVKTLERWRRALVGGPKARRKSGELVDARLLRATYRGYTAAIAAQCNVAQSIEAVLASDPALRANSDPAWAEAAKIRALAVYCVVIEFDLPAARVAAAIGVTRAAASAILKRVEDMRDDPATDALLERVGRMISGREE